MKTRILIYDDNTALRLSMEALIAEEKDFELVAAISNAETVVTDLEELQPDVVLMDIDMPVINGVEAVRKIRLINKQLPIIMLTVFDDNENIFSAICAGASGYILKRYVAEEIGPAIRNVLSGGAPMTGLVAKKVLQMVPLANTTNPEHSGLSARETEILQLLVSGCSYKMISSALSMTIDGVRFHIKKIYDKLHVHSATEAVAKAIRDRLVN